MLRLNQPTVYANVEALGWDGSDHLGSTSEKAHGRIEVRAGKVMTINTASLVGFHGARQVMQLERLTVRKKTPTAEPKLSAETFYMVTSIPFEQAKPDQLAAWARSHWTVESLRWIRDRVMDEDRHTIRTGNSAMNWAILRDATISAIRVAHGKDASVTQAQRAHRRNAHRTFEIIALTSQNALCKAS